MRVAINGFGRIGRSVFRILNFRENLDVVAINDIADNEAMAYLLKYDTVMGPFNDLVEIKGDVLSTSHNAVKMLAEKDPNQLPWGKMGVDVVIESTGIFRTKNQLKVRFLLHFTLRKISEKLLKSLKSQVSKKSIFRP